MTEAPQNKGLADATVVRTDGIHAPPIIHSVRLISAKHNVPKYNPKKPTRRQEKVERLLLS